MKQPSIETGSLELKDNGNGHKMLLSMSIEGMEPLRDTCVAIPAIGLKLYDKNFLPNIPQLNIKNSYSPAWYESKQNKK